MISGIYGIHCLATHEWYVGKAHDLSHRLNRHLNHLSKNEHINQHLQNAWNKYGDQYFDIEILEECDNKTLLCEKEIYWMELKDSLTNGYNKRPGGKGGDTFTHRSKEKQQAHREMCRKSFQTNNPRYRSDVWSKEKQIVDEYINENVTMRFLEKKYDASHCLIKTVLKKNNIDIRPGNHYTKGMIAWNKGMKKNV